MGESMYFSACKTRYAKNIRKAILVEGVMVLLLAVWIVLQGESIQQKMMWKSEAGAAVNGQYILPEENNIFKETDTQTDSKREERSEDYIKWVDFNVSYEALCAAYNWDVDTHDTEHEIDWVELLAYTAARSGGTFDKKALSVLNKTGNSLADGETTMEELTAELKYYDYYEEAYGAVLDGMVGDFEEETMDENGRKHYESRYGLKAYFPLAKGFDYNHYDDFGTGRSYGYKRKHLGHDMMGQVGTPVISIESGTIEALGWNQYGGWRIGIRSLDGKRYYYYAHLRQNYPYAEHLEEGSVVTAGDVIGYMGHTGYSTKENVNNIEVTHLHWGMELIFDESQKESNNEIWVDVYPLTRFLAKHCQQTEKVEGTKEWIRSTGMKDPGVEAYETQKKDEG